MMYKKAEILQRFKNGLIVSCQARKGWPMYGENILAAFSHAATCGGAVGIRANRPINIAAIKQSTHLPIIGINKIMSDKYEVYITPTLESAEEVIQAGADVVALDATTRSRPNGETLNWIVQTLKKKYPNVLIMGDVSTLEDATFAEKSGCDMVATTLSGFTKETLYIRAVNLPLISQLVHELTIPVIAEGRIETPQEAKKALECGAYAVVVGTAITRPEVITERFVKEIQTFRREVDDQNSSCPNESR